MNRTGSFLFALNELLLQQSIYFSSLNRTFPEITTLEPRGSLQEIGASLKRQKIF